MGIFLLIVFFLILGIILGAVGYAYFLDKENSIDQPKQTVKYIFINNSSENSENEEIYTEISFEECIKNS